MRFTRLVKAIECGTSIEKNGTSSQGGPDKITEASKKRKKTICDSDDSAMNQNNLLKKGQPASSAGNFGDDSDGGNIALGDKADGTLAARTPTKPRERKVATGDSEIDVSNLASSGMNSSKPIGFELQSFSAEEASQDINLPSGNLAMASEGPKRDQHVSQAT